MKKIRFMRGKASNGMMALFQELKALDMDVKRTKLRGSIYKGHPNHMIINWGAVSRGRVLAQYSIYNDPRYVAIASDKLETLRKLHTLMPVNIPRFTTSQVDVRNWFSEGSVDRVYCRTLTRGSQGRGIVIANTHDELVDAGLYTEGLEIDREVRVHVFQDRVIDFAQKKRMGSERQETEGIEEPNELIRSHNNGWIFARDGVGISDEVKEAARQAVRIIGLAFGAVDIVINPQGIPKVLEVNSAPGLEGTTLSKYAEAIVEECQRIS